ncbi:MAG: flagellar hook-basal body complex protein [Syntrophomonadaceae bacterium]|nr:flagellar hook-basal body complex protein [Syntrophomonadaceae bacterium]
MMRSMYSGVSGLRNHQTRMDVIGNNIANVNTAGFKKSRVVFKDMLYQNVRGASSPTGNRGGTNPMGVGLGMALSSIDQIHTGAPATSTGRLTDMAIDGNGYFVVNDGSNRYYTRAGAFDFDVEGNLETADGLRVQGWLANPDTWDLDTNGDPTNISIAGYKTIEARATTEMIFSGNLDSGLDFVSGRNEVQTLTFPTIANGGNLGGVFSLTLDDQTTGFIQVGANGTDTAARIQAALEALPNVGTGNVLVKWDQARGRYDITFQNTLRNTDILSTITFATPPAVVETIKGVPNNTNEVQTLSMGGVTKGTFTLTYGGVSTTPIDFGNDAAATATNIQTALAGIPALSTVGAVTVTPDGDDFRITFANTMGDVNLVSFTPVTGGAATVVTTTEGRAPLSVLLVNEVQELNLTTSTGGTYTLTYGNVTTAPIAFDADAATIQAAIETIPALNGNVSVTEITPPVSSTRGGNFTITFNGGLAGSNVDEMVINNLPGCDAIISNTTQGQQQINETQDIDNTTSAGGAFILTYNGVSTALINFDADAATIQAALEAIPALTGNINVTEITPPVSGTSGGRYSITFINALAGSNIPPMVLTNAPRCTGIPDTNTQGQAAANEIQGLNLTSASVGSFTLEYNSVPTAAINFDADATTIQAALEAIPALTGNITVTEITPPVAGTSGGNFTITFNNLLAGSNVPELNVTYAGGGTGPNSTTATTLGRPAVNEIQAVNLTAAVGGAFNLTYNGTPTALINFDANAAAIQAALDAIPALSGNITVAETTPPVAGTSGGSFTITFTNALASSNVPQIVLNFAPRCDGRIGTSAEGQPAINERQAVDLSAETEGTYSLVYNGVSTPLINFDADAAAIQAALEAIPTLTGNINVTETIAPVAGTSGGSFIITFTNTLAGTNVSQMGVNTMGSSGTIATRTPGQAAGYPEDTISGSKDVYDSQGNAVTVYYRFFKYEIEPGTYPGVLPVDQPETRWACDFSTDPLFEEQADYSPNADFGAVDLVTGTQTGTGDSVYRVYNIPFDEMGNIADPDHAEFTYDINRQVPPPGAGTANISSTINFAELTQRAGDASARARSQNGCAEGNLTSYAVGSDGTITGVYDNDQRRDLARVAIASFENPSGLQQMGGTLFAVSGNSGEANIGSPMTLGLGKIAPSSLEMSNVDLSEEFTDMIVTQRGFQANSRIITTSDEMLQELVNLKR